MSLTKESIAYEQEYGEARATEARAYYLQNVQAIRDNERLFPEAFQSRKEESISNNGTPSKDSK